MEGMWLYFIALFILIFISIQIFVALLILVLKIKMKSYLQFLLSVIATVLLIQIDFIFISITNALNTSCVLLGLYLGIIIFKNYRAT